MQTYHSSPLFINLDAFKGRKVRVIDCGKSYTEMVVEGFVEISGNVDAEIANVGIRTFELDSMRYPKTNAVASQKKKDCGWYRKFEKGKGW